MITTRIKQGARSIKRGAKVEPAHAPRPLPSDLQPPAFSLQPRRVRRPGISLLEVLIAMFVMLFGLMGVAAIFPVGNHYAGKGDQYDRGAALAGSAFAELKSRGLLRPGAWRDPNNGYIINQTTGWFVGDGQAFVIDPIGASQTVNLHFPFDANGGTNPWNGTPPSGGNLPPAGDPVLLPVSNNWPIRRVTLGAPSAVDPKMPQEIASAILRLRDDVAVRLPDQGDRPGIQRWRVNDNGTPEDVDVTDDIPLARAYTGSYSWLATVLPVDFASRDGLQPADPRFGQFLYEVSVAVFHKREDVPGIASERLLEAELGAGGDLVIFSANYDDVETASQDVRAGQWIAITGPHPTSGKLLLRWYRLLSFDDETDDVTGPNPLRRAMVEGPDWPTDSRLAPGQPAAKLRAILLPGVIGVSTQTLQLETD